MMKEMRDYRVLTRCSVEDIPYINDEQNQASLTALWEEQCKVIKEKVPSEYYKCTFVEKSQKCRFSLYVSDILEAIQCLSIKEGFDLVEFDNGDIGVIAYYGERKSGFIFEPCSKQDWMEVQLC